MTFIVTMHQDDEGTWIGHCPVIPGLRVEGTTMDEARYRLWETIQERLEEFCEQGIPIKVHVEEMEIPFGIEATRRN